MAVTTRNLRDSFSDRSRQVPPGGLPYTCCVAPLHSNGEALPQKGSSVGVALGGGGSTAELREEFEEVRAGKVPHHCPAAGPGQQRQTVRSLPVRATQAGWLQRRWHVARCQRMGDNPFAEAVPSEMALAFWTDERVMARDLHLGATHASVCSADRCTKAAPERSRNLSSDKCRRRESDGSALSQSPTPGAWQPRRRTDVRSSGEAANS